MQKCEIHKQTYMNSLEECPVCAGIRINQLEQSKRVIQEKYRQGELLWRRTIPAPTIKVRKRRKSC